MNPGRPQQRADISVVQVAEALVQGEVLIALQERGEAAPAWGYLNLLAHSDRSSLRRVRDFNQSRMPLSGWGTVVFDLIVDILNLVPTDEQLITLQRTALIPLELKILGRPGNARFASGSGHPRTERPIPQHGTALGRCRCRCGLGRKLCQERGITGGPARSLF